MTVITATAAPAFSLRPWQPHGLGARGPVPEIKAAYAAVGLTPELPDAEPVRQRLKAEPGAADISARLEADISAGKSPDLAATVADMARAQAVDSLLANLIDFESHALVKNGAALAAQAHTELRPHWIKVTKALLKAAQLLPAESPLDATAAFRDNLSQPYHQVMEALGTLGILASIYHARSADIPASLRALLYVASISEFSGPQRVDRLTGAPLSSPDPKRDAVRRLARIASRSKDEAIIRVARGEFTGIELAQPADDADLDRRMESAAWALTNQRSDSWGGAR